MDYVFDSDCASAHLPDSEVGVRWAFVMSSWQTRLPTKGFPIHVPFAGYCSFLGASCLCPVCRKPHAPRRAQSGRMFSFSAPFLCLLITIVVLSTFMSGMEANGLMIYFLVPFAILVYFVSLAISILAARLMRYRELRSRPPRDANSEDDQ